MKGSLDRTKVVLRHLPPTISQSHLADHIDSRFSGRYRWMSFRPGKPSLKHLTHSRAYIDFSRPDGVIEFAEFFNGHVFVNEKGTQFKAIVEYAPSQRVPKQLAKKDGREGTLLKDPEYLGFLEFVAKPVENLPSAEIQLERREAERAGAPKDVPVVTPLMEYVRQKRVAKFGPPRTVLSGKSSRRVGTLSKSPVSGSVRRGSEKRTSNTMYVSRNGSKGFGGKDKPTYLLVPKHDDKELAGKSAISVSGADAVEGESGGSGSTGIVNKILILKGNEKETLNASAGSSLQQNAPISSQNSHIPASFRQNQRCETNGRIIRSILINKDARQNQPLPGSQSELRFQASNQDRDKRPPRPPSIQETNRSTEDKVINNDVDAVHSEKQERRTKNKNRPDRGVWAPLRYSEGSHASDDSLSSSASQTSQVLDSAEDGKNEMLVTRDANYRHVESGRNNQSRENGSYRNGRRRGSAYNVKDTDNSFAVDVKPLKRGGSSEKQMWVQKAGSGS